MASPLGDLANGAVLPQQLLETQRHGAVEEEATSAGDVATA